MTDETKQKSHMQNIWSKQFVQDNSTKFAKNLSNLGEDHVFHSPCHIEIEIKKETQWLSSANP